MKVIHKYGRYLHITEEHFARRTPGSSASATGR